MYSPPHLLGEPGLLVCINECPAGKGVNLPREGSHQVVENCPRRCQIPLPAEVRDGLGILRASPRGPCPKVQEPEKPSILLVS